jgi:hypothetical protein
MLRHQRLSQNDWSSGTGEASAECVIEAPDGAAGKLPSHKLTRVAMEKGCGFSV